MPPDPAQRGELERSLRAFVGRPIGPRVTARDPVNEPMIRQWCDAMGDANPVYLDADAARGSVFGGIVAPPTMLDAWTMQGWSMHEGYDTPQNEEQRLHKLLSDAGYTGVLGTDTEQAFHRYLQPGDVVSAETVIEHISEEKTTGAGVGYFITTRTRFADQRGHEVGWQTFRVLKFVPREAPRAVAPASAAPARPSRLKPPQGHDNAWWWREVAERDHLPLQRCQGCAKLRHPPRPMCDRCGSLAWDSIAASGRGTAAQLHRDPLPAVSGLRVPDRRRSGRSRGGRAHSLEPGGLRARPGADRHARPVFHPPRRRRLQAAALPTRGVSAMDFSFSDEQNAIRELAREILAREAEPERIKRAERSPDWCDEALWQKLAGANLLGVAIPETHGGTGSGFGELCVLLEELGRAVAPTPAFATLVLGALPLARFGSEEQQRALLPRVAAGSALLTAALDDADAAERAAPATRAARISTGYTLTGAKRFVPCARRAEAILVPARLAGAVAVFLVPPGAPGVRLLGRTTSTGEPLFDVELAGARLDAGARLPGDGAALVRWLEPRALVALAALQLGVSDRALALTAAYTRERQQFGVAIGSFQAVQHREADAFIDLEAMRWTCWRAASRLAADEPAEREARVAKLWAAEGGSRIANAALHLHGGIGADVDYPIHRHFLWSKALELALGGAPQQLAALGAELARTGPGALA